MNSSTSELKEKKRRSAWIWNAALAALSLTVLFAGLEIAVRFSGSDYRSHGLFHVDREKLVSFLPGSLGRYKTSEFDVTIQANRFGRRDKEWSEEVLRDPQNILLVGDSMILGYGLEDGEAIPSRLEAVLEAGSQKKTEVFNFGMGGAISIPEYKVLFQEALGMGISARRVVAGIFIGNDFSSEVVMSESFLIKHSAFFRWVQRKIAASPGGIRWLFQAGKILKLDVYQSTESYLFLKNTDEKKMRFFYAKPVYSNPQIEIWKIEHGIRP